MELAERLGMTVGQLMETMSSTEYTAWIALHNLRSKEAEKARQQQKLKNF
jgi:hypothetical protein